MCYMFLMKSQKFCHTLLSTFLDDVEADAVAKSLQVVRRLTVRNVSES